MSVDTSLPSLAELRVMRLPEVRAAVGLSETRIRELEKTGKFPKRISIGDYAVAWREIEIREFLHKRGERGYTQPKGATALNDAALPRTPVATPARALERQYGPVAGVCEAVAEHWVRARLGDGRWHRATTLLDDAEQARPRLSTARVKKIAARICEREGRGVGAQLRLLPAADATTGV